MEFTTFDSLYYTVHITNFISCLSISQWDVIITFLIIYHIYEQKCSISNLQ